MPINDSRLSKGTLTFGPKLTPVMTLSCQATDVSIEPKSEEKGDRIEVLCGDALAPVAVTSYALKFTGIQDWKEKDSFINYAYDHDGEDADFEWMPAQGGPTWTGKVNVRALLIGGKVSERLTSEAEWPCQGKPVRADAPDPSGAPVKATAGAT